MLVDLIVKGREVVVAAEGSEALKRANQLLDASASVTVICRRRTDELEELERKGKINLILVRRQSLQQYLKVIKERRPYLVVLDTQNRELDRRIASFSRRIKALTYVVDYPALNDFNMPAIAKFGDWIRVGISTGGSSPAMASTLRRRIEKLIDNTDLLEVEMLRKLRNKIMSLTRDRSERREVIYSLIQNKKIRGLLRQGKLEEAKKNALAIVESKTNSSRKNERAPKEVRRKGPI
jgi:precorrin-2 dehydrogenase/sirohydrochlorin ferrochelatase